MGCAERVSDGNQLGREAPFTKKWKGLLYVAERFASLSNSPPSSEASVSAAGFCPVRSGSVHAKHAYSLSVMHYAPEHANLKIIEIKCAKVSLQRWGVNEDILSAAGSKGR